MLAKSLRTSVWKTKDVCIGGRNPTDINFATIGNQVQFVDSIKYCQRSLGALASSLTISEKSAIYDECKNNLFQDKKVSKAFENLNQNRSRLGFKLSLKWKGGNSISANIRL